MSQTVATTVFNRMRTFFPICTMWKRSETLNTHSLINVQLLNPASSLSILYFQFNNNIMKADKPDTHTGTGGIKHQEPAHEQIPITRCKFSFLI